jgi:hypothetical protein
LKNGLKALLFWLKIDKNPIAPLGVLIMEYNFSSTMQHFKSSAVRDILKLTQGKSIFQKPSIRKVKLKLFTNPMKGYFDVFKYNR